MSYVATGSPRGCPESRPLYLGNRALRILICAQRRERRPRRTSPTAARSRARPSSSGGWSSRKNCRTDRGSPSTASRYPRSAATTSMIAAIGAFFRTTWDHSHTRTSHTAHHATLADPRVDLLVMALSKAKPIDVVSGRVSSNFQGSRVVDLGVWRRRFASLFGSSARMSG